MECIGNFTQGSVITSTAWAGRFSGCASLEQGTLRTRRCRAKGPFHLLSASSSELHSFFTFLHPVIHLHVATDRIIIRSEVKAWAHMRCIRNSGRHSIR